MNDTNREQLITAARLLGPLLGELVFVGGCVTGLLITDEAAGEPRPTLDVDAIAEGVITAPLFLATKIEAFKGRGHGDLFGSHDLEDLIAVVDGRPSLSSEIIEGSADVRAYISGEIRTLLAMPGFGDALPGYLLPDEASQARITTLLHRLERLASR